MTIWPVRLQDVSATPLHSVFVGGGEMWPQDPGLLLFCEFRASSKVLSLLRGPAAASPGHLLETQVRGLRPRPSEAETVSPSFWWPLR